MGGPHPHLLRHRAAVLLAREGAGCSPAALTELTCSLLSCRGWDELLHRWWLPDAIEDDAALSRSDVAARRYGQISVLRAAGLSHERAVSAAYELHPTSECDPRQLPSTIPDAGFLVRDGAFASILRKGGRTFVETGYGRALSSGLQVQTLLERRTVDGPESEASEIALSFLRATVESLRAKFVERRGFYRNYAGVPVETNSGGMDAIEVISPHVMKAAVSTSGDPGCYILSSKGVEMLPSFAVFDSHPDGYGVVGVGGMGLVVPLLFRRDFEPDEITAAETELQADFPVTYRILKGEIANTIPNHNAAATEWDEDHDPADVPEYMLVDTVRKGGPGRKAVVIAVRTEDVLNNLPFPDGHLFAVPPDEADDDLVIDPSRHRLLRPKGVGIKVFRKI